MKRRKLALLTVIGLVLAVSGCKSAPSQSSTRIYTDGLAASDSLGCAVYSESSETREASARATSGRLDQQATAGADR